jgi:2-oxoglutarate dehydrogenase E1 component
MKFTYFFKIKYFRGYRRHGHNNLDDPRITQPLTYSLIDSHPPIFNIYSDKLISQGIITESKLMKWKQEIEKYSIIF